MPDMYFAYNGVDSRNLGVRLERPIELSAARQNTEKIVIPGRNGVLHYWDGTYANREAVARCFALNRSVGDYLAEIQNWLNMSADYKRFEMPDEPDTYMMARVSDSGDVQIYQDVLAPFTVKFDCMPQKFLKSGEIPVEVENGDILYNDWMEAKPLITIYGYGTGDLIVGDTTVSVTNAFTGYITLDCETQNAYRGEDNMNSYIDAMEFPIIPHGTTSVSWSAKSGEITQIEIIPRWWHL